MLMIACFLINIKKLVIRLTIFLQRGVRKIAMGIYGIGRAEGGVGGGIPPAHQRAFYDFKFFFDGKFF